MDRETDYIASYKDYAEHHLPMTESLEGLWAADFSTEKSDKSSYISDLRIYLNQLEKYSKCLTRAAYLRQNHYELFIQDKRDEDDGHRHWREGMNAIAKDAEEKLEYWGNVHERVFDEYADEYAKKVQRRKEPPVAVYYTKNVDFVEKPKKSKKFVSRPALSKQERNKRKREKKKALQLIRKVEHALLDKHCKFQNMQGDVEKKISENGIKNIQIISFKRVYEEYKKNWTSDDWIDSFKFLGSSKTYRIESKGSFIDEGDVLSLFLLIKDLVNTSLQEEEKISYHRRKEIDTLYLSSDFERIATKSFSKCIETKKVSRKIGNATNIITHSDLSFMFVFFMDSSAKRHSHEEVSEFLKKSIKNNKEENDGIPKDSLIYFAHTVYSLWFHKRYEKRYEILKDFKNEYQLCLEKHGIKKAKSHLAGLIGAHNQKYANFNLFHVENPKSVKIEKCLIKIPNYEKERRELRVIINYISNIMYTKIKK